MVYSTGVVQPYLSSSLPHWIPVRVSYSFWVSSPILKSLTITESSLYTNSPTGDTTAAVPVPNASSSVAPVTQDVDQGITGHARKYGSFQRCGVDFAGDLEHDVHGSNFLYIFTMYAVQPQNLGASHLLCFYLACDGACIVTAAFCEACAAFDCTDIFILNQDLNRVDALCIVCSNRSGDDNEFVGFISRRRILEFNKDGCKEMYLAQTVPSLPVL